MSFSEELDEVAAATEAVRLQLKVADLTSQLGTSRKALAESEKARGIAEQVAHYASVPLKPPKFLGHKPRGRGQTALLGTTLSDMHFDERIEPEQIHGLNAYCVDTDTEALTRRGWMSVSDLTTDDEILTMNAQSGQGEWQTVEAINTFFGEFPVLQIERRNHSSVTTRNHRWLVQNRSRGLEWTTTDRLSVQDAVPMSVVGGANRTASMEDEFAELVGWFWTEGSVNLRSGAVRIFQSETANPAKVDRIRQLLQSLYGDEHTGPTLHVGATVETWQFRSNTSGVGCSYFKVSRSVGNALKAAAPNRCLSTEFIMALTQAQLDRFIEASLLADGSWDKRHDSWSIGQSDYKRLEAFQLACTVAGQSSTMAPKANRNGMWRLGVHRIAQSWVLANASKRNGSLEKRVLTGMVWCPTTANGTWIARRRGTVFVTGNSREIAIDRLERYYERFVHIAKHYWTGTTYTGIVAGLGGDGLSGDIHELKETNEDTSLSGMFFWAERIAAGMEYWLSEFPDCEFYVPCMYGNHPRLTDKPSAKRAARNNLDWGMFRLLATHFKDEPRVTFEITEGFAIRFNMHDVRFLYSHGDVPRSTGGGGVGGIWPTIKRNRGKLLDQFAHDPFDIWLLHHYHTRIPFADGLGINGSLKGTDEWSLRMGFRPEAAKQSMWTVTPEHGVTYEAPIYVTDRKSEGW